MGRGNERSHRAALNTITHTDTTCTPMTQPRWLALAWGDLGVAETPGADHTQRVVRYYADVGHAQIANDETAWCAAFLGSCLERAGAPSTRSLMARSYLSWGDSLAEFRLGAVAVLSRTADPALGHAGFLIGETEGSVILLGGNQSDAVTVEDLGSSNGTWVNDTYWLLMPYKLRDPGVSLAYAGEERGESGATYDKVKLSFDNVGLTPKDNYWVWVNRDTGLVDRWDYVLKGEDVPPTTWTWTGWKKHGGIMLASERMNAKDNRKLLLHEIAVLESVPDAVFTSPDASMP